MILENWFPTPIFYTDANEQIKNDIYKEYLNIENIVNNNLSSKTWGDNVDTTFNTIDNIIVNNNLFLLNSFITSVAKEFDKYIGSNAYEIVLKDSWINCNKPNQHQDIHDHLPGYISGVYYLKTNGQDGNLRIIPPTQIMSIYQNHMEYQPKEGRIILFPSWVQHSVKSNLTNLNRISVSFNFDRNKK